MPAEERFEFIGLRNMGTGMAGQPAVGATRLTFFNRTLGEAQTLIDHSAHNMSPGGTPAPCPGLLR